ncbi:MAG TPA: ARMT1-like domain-containing protein [candidate division Zixibacteria bacterium]|nr:ARMT1-like domain-containing protein [candidate division Zixibacteria bacterium]
MKTYLDCIPCFFEQALRAGRVATDDERVLKHLLDELGRLLKDISLDSTPPETGRLVYQLVNRITGNPDPFKGLKRESTVKALSLYPQMKQVIEQADDRLLTAIRIAIAGNIIDFGPSGTFDIEATLDDALTRNFAVCDYEIFKRDLATAGQILYIGDNAGETVFDRLLIEQLDKPTLFVVREQPILNDATREDALEAGIDKVATIVSSGADAPGAVLNTCSPEFRKMLEEAEFIIAKGQGNYEALSNYHRPIFFLLKAKCKLIADDLGVSIGDIILKGINV